MTVAIYLLLALLLLALNAFFVLAEFAAIKVRASRIEQLAAEGNSRARTMQHIQSHLDEYLSVCQVGITFASIGLGYVGEPSFARLIVMVTGLHSAAAHSVAVAISIVIVSALHIVVGELLPKSLAIRSAERSALFAAQPLRFFRILFYPPLVILNGVTRWLLRLFRIPIAVKETEHSEEELRILLAQSQDVGMMSFDRLLLLENIFDLEGLKVRDVMRPRAGVKVLKLGAPWEENARVIRESRFSRFPLVQDGNALPLGIVHVKDLLYEAPERLPTADLRAVARPSLTTLEETPLERLLGELRRQRGHLAIVRDAKGAWTGVISLEDVIEEIVGTIEDEFETEPPIYLIEALTPGRVVLGVEAPDLEEAIRSGVMKVPPAELPLPADRVIKAVLERERAMSTYLGGGLAVPHARVEGIEKPAVILIRSESGVPVKGRADRAHLIFVLLTPAGAPRSQVRLLARICKLVESGYVADHLRQAPTAAEVLELVKAAEPITV